MPLYLKKKPIIKGKTYIDYLKEKSDKSPYYKSAYNEELKKEAIKDHNSKSAVESTRKRRQKDRELAVDKSY